MDLVFGQTDKPYPEIYQLLIGCVNPRPIALVSTLSADGRPNLAPFSFFNMVSGRPPVLIVCPALRRDGTPKDTLRNIRATGEFVVNVVTAAMAPATARAGADLPPGASEWEYAPFTPVPARLVKPACVKESPVHIECRLREIVVLGTGPSAGNVIFGDLLAIHVDDAVCDERGRIDPLRLPTVGRLGRKWYCNVQQPYELEIPVV